jgi:glycosyltransferase involved in cell wall biosynthesis
MSVDVSLIMPAWRPRADWLLAAVESALEEPDAEVELIVVDDGSPEPFERVLAEIGDSRLRVMRREHAGPYAARNSAIAAARGRYIRFVDADDIVEAGSTGRLLARAAEGEEAIAYGATLVCDEGLRPQHEFASQLEGWVAEACLVGALHVYVVSMLFPSAVVERAGGWEERGFAVSGDWDFVLRALEQAPARRVDEVVTRYRRHSGSVTKTADVAAGAAAGRLVIERFFDRHPEKAGSELERRAYTRLHLDRARAYAWAGRRAPAARELAAALRRDPAWVAAAGVRRSLRRMRRRS